MSLWNFRILSLIILWEKQAGAGAIFGVTGGVMEAALRTAVENLEGRTLEKIEFEEVRGKEGIKKAKLTITGKEIKIAVVSGLKNAEEVMEQIKNKNADFDFVEVMACPGGCILGGGQPIKSAKTRNVVDVFQKRAKSLYEIDKNSKVRKSHENPYIKETYQEFFGKPRK